MTTRNQTNQADVKDLMQLIEHKLGGLLTVLATTEDLAAAKKVAVQKLASLTATVENW